MTTTNVSGAHGLAMEFPAVPAVLNPLIRSLTVRNWLRTLAWTLAAVGVCGFLYIFDKYQGWFEFSVRRPPQFRMFHNPTELPMRIFGIPHFIIGLLFAVKSRRMESMRNRLIFAALALVAIGFCFAFRSVGAHLNPFALFLFYFYFVIHGLRDDAFFYKTYGDMPAEARATHERIVQLLQVLTIGLLLSLFWPVAIKFASKHFQRTEPIMENFFPADWPFVLRLASLFIPMVVIALVVMGRMARSFPDGLAGLWHAHRPILTVYLFSIAIILLALVGGPWTFNIVVLMHFVGWYLFALFLIHRHPPRQPPAGLWAWMRSTRSGFMTLHLGLAALVTVLIALSVYGSGRTDILETIVGSKSFYYWTIVHVTLSFLPR